MHSPSPSAVLAVMALVFGSPELADAHSKLTVPKPSFPNAYGSVAPSGYIDGPSVLSSSTSFALQPEQNARTFAEAFKTSKYKSLRELVLATYAPEPNTNKQCGVTALEGERQPVPNYVEWQTIDASHHGPCEVWCDDALAYHHDDCLKAAPSGPHRLPYDKSKCAGAKRLQAIWLAVHFSKWQVYINCATLGGGGTTNSSGKEASGPEAPAASTPASADAAPAPAAPTVLSRGWQDTYRSFVNKYAAPQDWTKVASNANKNLRK